MDVVTVYKVSEPRGNLTGLRLPTWEFIYQCERVFGDFIHQDCEDPDINAYSFAYYMDVKAMDIMAHGFEEYRSWTR